MGISTDCIKYYANSQNMVHANHTLPGYTLRLNTATIRYSEMTGDEESDVQVDIPSKLLLV